MKTDARLLRYRMLIVDERRHLNATNKHRKPRTDRSNGRSSSAKSAKTASAFRLLPFVYASSRPLTIVVYFWFLIYQSLAALTSLARFSLWFVVSLSSLHSFCRFSFDSRWSPASIPFSDRATSFSLAHFALSILQKNKEKKQKKGKKVIFFSLSSI